MLDLALNDVAQKIGFVPDSDTRLGENLSTADRLLYYDLLHVDEHEDVLSGAFALAAARLGQPTRAPHDSSAAPKLSDFDTLDRVVTEMRRWWSERQDQIYPAFVDLSRDQCKHLLLQYAPIALLDGCWMQNFSSAVNSHTEVAAGILKLYSHEVGDGDHALHHGNAFRDMIQSLGIYLPDVAAVAFTEERAISDVAFRNPVFLLSVSQFPRSFTPEILGLTLFYYVCGIPPVYLALRPPLARFGANTRFLDEHMLQPSIDEAVATVIGVIKRYMEAVRVRSTNDVDSHWERIRRGFDVARSAAIDESERALLYARSPEKTPRQKMIQLIASKVRHAQGYHADSQLDGRSIDDWLSQPNAEQFLDALARSKHVKPGDAKGSHFFRHLVAFRGPMFRIFPPDELQVIADWIDSLPQDGTAEVADTNQLTIHPAPNLYGVDPGVTPTDRSSRAVCDGGAVALYARKPLGEIYYYLLNIEDFPDVRWFAKQFATRWLYRAGRDLRRGNLRLPFAPYRHEELESWLEAQHMRQLGSYQRQTAEPSQTREEVIESTLQLAPMILIDGAWIQNASNAGTSHTRVGSKLFHIYVDEVGNGDVNLNHPNVFRELLAQMQVEMPEFGTLEFGRWPRFRPESFRVPVFWLSISQFPKHFLSETLGLNLAMELSGVGGSYRSAIDTLRFYGYDPCFVELHNNIDNVSTGHTRWAIDAIKCHLDDMFFRGGAPLVEEHWRRIWTGYRALAPQNVNLAPAWSFLPSFWKH